MYTYTLFQSYEFGIVLCIKSLLSYQYNWLSKVLTRSEINTKGILMNEIREVDRFECQVINVIQNLIWKGVTVEEKSTKGRVYFGRVDGELGINLGNPLYLGVKPVYDVEDRTMRVTLYDVENKKLDWTLI